MAHTARAVGTRRESLDQTLEEIFVGALRF